METDETTKAAEEFFAGTNEKPMLKMSEVFAAMNEHRLEMDCIGGLIGYDKERVLTQCNITKLSITKKSDVRLVLIHQGVPEMVRAMINGDGNATAYISKYAMEEDLSFARSMMMRLMDIHGGESDDAEGCGVTGKEGEDNE